MSHLSTFFTHNRYRHNRCIDYAVQKARKPPENVLILELQHSSKSRVGLVLSIRYIWYAITKGLALQVAESDDFSTITIRMDIQHALRTHARRVLGSDEQI